MNFTVTHKLFLTQGLWVAHMLASPITKTLEIPTFVLHTQRMLWLLWGQNTQGKALKGSPVLQNDTTKVNPFPLQCSLSMHSPEFLEQPWTMWLFMDRISRDNILLIRVRFCCILLPAITVTLTVLCSLQRVSLYRKLWVMGKSLLAKRAEAMSEDIHFRTKLSHARLD